VCDPQLQVVPSNVTLNADPSAPNGTLSVTLLPTSEGFVGNIPYRVVSQMTSQGLIGAVGFMDLDYDDDGGDVAVNTILTSSLSNYAFLPSFVIGKSGMFAPASLEYINTAMDKLMASAAKAYASGFVNSTDTAVGAVPAVVEVERLALATSKVAWIITLALFVAGLAALLVALSFGAMQRHPFDLRNVASASIRLAGTDSEFRERMLRDDANTEEAPEDEDAKPEI